MAADVRRRQAAGELAEELDPAHVLLVLFAAASAPGLLPQVVRGMTGLAADSPEFLDGYRAELRRIVERLGPAGAGAGRAEPGPVTPAAGSSGGSPGSPG
jgi:hypothetical protein